MCRPIFLSPKRKLFQRLVFLLGALVLATGCLTITLIQPGEMGVIFNRLTGDLGDPMSPGSYFTNSITDEITIYSTQQQMVTFDEDASRGRESGAVRVVFADGEEGLISAVLLFRIDPAMVNRIHARWQNRYVGDFIVPVVRGMVRDVASRYTAEQSYTETRINFEQDIQEQIAERLSEEGFILDDFLIPDITFSERYSRMIEMTQIAEMTATAAPATPAP